MNHVGKKPVNSDTVLGVGSGARVASLVADSVDHRTPGIRHCVAAR
jgi:hypothetical protein